MPTFRSLCYLAAPPLLHEQNKEHPRASLMVYERPVDAVANAPARSPYYQSLNGTWKFSYVGRPADRPLNFPESGLDEATWKPIAVPFNWKLRSSDFVCLQLDLKQRGVGGDNSWGPYRTSNTACWPKPTATPCACRGVAPRPWSGGPAVAPAGRLAPDRLITPAYLFCCLSHPSARFSCPVA